MIITPAQRKERAEVQCHPVVGVRILGELKLANRYLPAIRHHHERIDGAGYPDGLTGQAIPLDARLMAIADAYDAMTSHRPYRPALPVERALEILAENAGPQWDEELVNVFVEMMRRAERGLEPTAEFVSHDGGAVRALKQALLRASGRS